MTEATAEPKTARVAFTGGRGELTGIILRGYALMIPTLGLYRFWQATAKRRFYWQNTVIDGDPLEYTGRASQLLIGFLFALAVFVPIYMGLFYLSMQETTWLLYAYGALAVLFWFFLGYGAYRARDFRLSRTLWRGIRCNLHGNAWAYAARRFLWSILVIVTAGLAWPWMAASLWRYRWRHTWFGDRHFELGGTWRAFAFPFYVAYFANIAVVIAGLVMLPGAHELIDVGGVHVPGPMTAVLGIAELAFFLLTYAWYRASTTSRMLSTLTLGEAKLTVKLPTFRLVLQYLGYGLGLLVAISILAIIGLVAIGAILAASGVRASLESQDIAAAFQSGTGNVVLLIAAYLVVLGTFGLLWEVILGFGWWRLLARSSSIAMLDSISTIKATGEDKSLMGQGLADALNVGAY